MNAEWKRLSEEDWGEYNSESQAVALPLPPPDVPAGWDAMDWRRVMRWVIGFLTAGSLSLGIESIYQAFEVVPNQLTVKEVSLHLLPGQISPLRVAAISDIHVGAPFIDLNKLQKIVDEVNASHPDVIVLLGDYVIHGVLGGTFVTPEEFAPVLSGLKAPHGVYAILGNHDWWYDGFRIQREFEKAGIRVLEDDVAELKTEGGSVWLAGLGDKETRHAHIKETFSKIPMGAPVIALTHNPGLAAGMPERASLILSGHTHGGQFHWAFMDSRWIPQSLRRFYAAGLYQKGAQHLYITSGIGTGGIPARLGVPPEISILDLQP